MINQYNHELPKNSCFCIVGGDGLVGEQAKWLVKSIRSVYPDKRIYFGIPNTEEQSAKIEAGVNIVRLDFPIKDYSYSIKAGLLDWVDTQTTHEVKILMDSDCLVLDKIRLPNLNSDMYLKPEDIKPTWVSSARDFWRRIYDKCNTSMPKDKITTTVDKQRIWPYYQGGVVMINSKDIGERLIAYERKIHDHLTNPKFTDQIALSVIATEVNTERLAEDMNYPINLRFADRPATQIVHYKQYMYLLKLLFNRSILRKIGMNEKLNEEWPQPDRTIRRLWDFKDQLKHRYQWSMRGQHNISLLD